MSTATGEGGVHERRWPAAIETAIAAQAGALLAVVPQSGMSGARVLLLRGERTDLVLKATPDAVEPAFYAQVAPTLRAAGVPIPHCYARVRSGGLSWLLLEALPRPLPPPAADGQPDWRVLVALHTLHRSTRDADFALPRPPDRPWQAALPADDLDDALELFPPERRAALRAQLLPWLRETLSRGGPRCWVSGDPNPRNWGERTDGSVALFDWELFQPGDPASDLAISIAGLGDRVAFEAVARRYHALGRTSDASDESVDDATGRMAAYKVRTVVRVLAGSARDSVRAPAEVIEALLQRVPGWLAALVG